MGSRQSIPFFTDHNVPESVGDFLIRAGHQVTRLRHVMATRTSDPIIAVACSRSGHVLVSHDNDFRQIAKRLEITQRQYRNSLHRIQLCCPEPNSSKRMEEALSLIESEWLLVKADRPMVFEIGNQYIRILRQKRVREVQYRQDWPVRSAGFDSFLAFSEALSEFGFPLPGEAFKGTLRVSTIES